MKLHEMVACSALKGSQAAASVHNQRTACTSSDPPCSKCWLQDFTGGCRLHRPLVHKPCVLDADPEVVSLWSPALAPK